MSPNSKPSVSLSKVPSVKELCELLGFQHASLKDTNAFMEATHFWRKSYKTSSGHAASQLILWNESSVQLDLEEMAQKFIEDKGNGDRFWSPGRSWSHDFDLQMPDDKARIVELLKQLFWKQNRYAFNNAHYGHKGTESRDESRAGTRPIREPTTPSNPPVASPQAAKKADQTLHNKTPQQHDEGVEDVQMKHATIKSRGINLPSNADIFEVSDDSEPGDHSTATRPLKKSQVDSTIKTTDGPPLKRKRHHPKASPRRTDRKRTVRNIPGAVPEDEVEERIKMNESGVHEHTAAGHTPSPTQNRSLPTISNARPSTHKGLHQPSHTGKLFAAPTAPMVAAQTQMGTPPHHVPNDSKLVKLKLSKVESARSKSQRGTLSALRGPEHATFTSPKAPDAPEPKAPSQIESDLQIAAVDEASTALSAAANGNTSIENEEVRLSKSPATAELNSPPRDVNTRLKSLNASANPGNNVTCTATQKQFEDTNQDDRPLVSSLPLQYGDRSFKRTSPAPNIQQMKVPLETTAPHSSTIGSFRNEKQPSVHSTEIAQRSATQPSSAKQRQKTQIPLWIITRDPIYTEERWDDGKFQGTALPAFIEGISKVTQRDHIEKIKLTLRTSEAATKITVFKDAEDMWASAKETFAEKLKEAKAHAKARRQSEPMNFKILVEPLYDESMLPAGSIDDDDEEFEF